MQWMVLEQSDDNTLRWMTNCPDENDRYITWTRQPSAPATVPIAQAFVVAEAVAVNQGSAPEAVSPADAQSRECVPLAT